MRAWLWILLFLQDGGLREEIDKLVAGSGLKDARIGIHLYDPATDAVLYARDDGELYTLASNTKVLTCAAALDRLGPDYKFTTSLHLLRRDGGATLYVTGNGDPNLSGRFFDGDPTAVFKRWAEALRKLGIEKVDGVVLVNEGFDDETLCPGWQKYDPWWWWMAPFGTFSLNDNCIDFNIEAGPVAQAARIAIVPDTKYVTIHNKTTTVKGAPKKPWGFTRKTGTNEITFTGELAAGAKPPTNWVTIHDPYRFFGTVLLETLAAGGIATGGKVEIAAKREENLVLLATHETDLATTLQVCLTVSQNFYAEMILRALGRERKGIGSRANGLQVVREFLKEVGIAQYEQSDGSGLSRENRMSPRDMTKLFRHIRGHKHAKVFTDALAVNGGETGTLKKRMKDFAGRVHAKTGHIKGVANLSGYLRTARDGTLIFSILVNDWNDGNPDRFQDRLCEFLMRR